MGQRGIDFVHVEVEIARFRFGNLVGYHCALGVDGLDYKADAEEVACLRSHFVVLRWLSRSLQCRSRSTNLLCLWYERKLVSVFRVCVVGKDAARTRMLSESYAFVSHLVHICHLVRAA